MNDQGNITTVVPKLSCDIRAEILVADLLERGISINDIIIYPHGSFKRRYKKDVSHIEEIKLSNGRAGIGVHLNRDGIYDALPEALFHDVPTESIRGVSDMARNSKKQKKREKESRTFFLPFENELFYQRVLLELAERKIMQRLSENLLQDIFPGFWNIDRDLPKELEARLMLFLQYSHKFVGNLQLTAEILALIINEKVSVQWKEVSKSTGPDIDKNSRGHPGGLGYATLGIDSLCGSQVQDELPSVEFVIGPLENTEMSDYLKNGKINRFIEMFFGFFIPLEINASKRVLSNSARNEFTLNDDKPCYLGYDTILQSTDLYN